MDVQVRTAIGRTGLFDEEHPAVARAASHQVLRALEYKIPAQMGKTNQIELP
jgi:hypothetical protein